MRSAFGVEIRLETKSDESASLIGEKKRVSRTLRQLHWLFGGVDIQLSSQRAASPLFKHLAIVRCLLKILVLVLCAGALTTLTMIKFFRNEKSATWDLGVPCFLMLNTELFPC